MSFLSGEAGKVYDRTFVEGTLSSRQWTSLWVNGAVAFGLNVVSFTVSASRTLLQIVVLTIHWVGQQESRGLDDGRCSQRQAGLDDCLVGPA